MKQCIPVADVHITKVGSQYIVSIQDQPNTVFNSGGWACCFYAATFENALRGARRRVEEYNEHCEVQKDQNGEPFRLGMCTITVMVKGKEIPLSE